MGKNLKRVVPYRDSALTRMLQDAIGGNSATIMVAAIRPGHTYYDETLNTLKYADRAKKIKNKPTVNEDPQAKLIRELQEENAKLRAQLGGGPAAAGSPGTGGKLLEGRDAFIPPDHSSLEPRVLGTWSPSPRYCCCSCNVTANYKESGMRSEIADNSRDDL